jgi:hypothetical protein
VTFKLHLILIFQNKVLTTFTSTLIRIYNLLTMCLQCAFHIDTKFLCTSISIQIMNLPGIKPSTLHYIVSTDTNFYALALAFNLWDYQASSLNFALHGEYILHKFLFLKCTFMDLFKMVHMGIFKNIHPRAYACLQLINLTP